MTPFEWAALVVAGALGSVARLLLTTTVQHAVRRPRTDLPLGTFVVNASGSLALGLLLGWQRHHGLSSSALVIAGTGFCGAFTTFSTFAAETVALLERSVARVAFANMAVTFAVSCGAIALGLLVASL